MAMRNTALQVAIWQTGRPNYEIATAARISESRLSRILHGRAVPSRAEVLRLSNVLGRAPAELKLQNGGKARLQSP
jgi:transcriptional regulator with XRE-family HTH domain